MQQGSLFDLPEPPPALPPGMVYGPEFLSTAEEADLITLLRQLPLAAARYKDYTARRRVVSYGGSFDYDSNRLLPAEPLPAALQPWRDRMAAWAGIAPAALVHALVAEYAPGTPLGWHRDVPDFEDVIGLSLGAPAVLRFRPYEPGAARRSRADILAVTAAPRSIYLLRGPARWQWQHSVAPVAALRWSLTLRTARAGARRPGDGM
ncbi:MAG: alpha-ketoglutarate-dependent dioxygenase AlkB [Aquincola tertiaricarbonis]